MLTPEAPEHCVVRNQSALSAEVAFVYYYINEQEQTTSEGLSSSVSFSYMAILPLIFFINLSL